MSKRVTGQYSIMAKRILRIIKIKGITRAEFYRKAGLSRGFVDTANNIGSDKILKISKAYSDLNLIWFITGKGEPFLTELPPSTERKKGLMERIEDVRSRYSQMQQEIQLLSGEVKKVRQGKELSSLELEQIEWLNAH